MPNFLVRNFTPSAFQKGTAEAHYSRTYYVLRWWMAIIGLSIPCVLWIWTWSVTNQTVPNESISGYYYAHKAWVGDFFVGALSAVGVCLVMYRGYTFWENQLLNFAGLGIIGVAFFPVVQSRHHTFRCSSLVTLTTHVKSTQPAHRFSCLVKRSHCTQSARWFSSFA